VDNRDMKLKPGMTANVSIVIAEKKEALRVPNAALRFRPPEVFSKDVKTNGAAGGTTNSPTTMAANGPAAGAGGRPGGGPNGPGSGRRGGGFGGPGGPGGGRPHTEHQPVRTVYILADRNDPTKLKPVQVKVGISDGVYTEVLDGITENDVVVTGINQPSDQVQSGPPSGGFGGRGGTAGFRRF